MENSAARLVCKSKETVLMHAFSVALILVIGQTAIEAKANTIGEIRKQNNE